MNETSCDGPHTEWAEKFVRLGHLPDADPPDFRENPTVTGERRRAWAWLRSWWLVALVAAAVLIALAIIGSRGLE